MRIALVSDTYTPQVNGVTTVVVRIATVLREFGHHVAVVAPRYPGHVPTDPAELRVPSAAFPPYPAIRLSLPDPYSFPPGHAAAASAMGGTIALAHPLLAPVLLPLAAVIALSRVRLRVHHVGDVIVGMVLGLAGAVGAAALILQ